MATLVNASVIKQYAPGEARLRVTARVNVRSAPTRTAARVGRRELEERMFVTQLLLAETYLDNPYWYRLDSTAEQYVWAGAVDSELQPADGDTALSTLPVNRRPDGTILPLNEKELMARYGPFHYQEGANGAIRIDPPWENAHIVEFTHKLVTQMDLRLLRVHKAALSSFRDVFNAIEQAGPEVSTCMCTCGGTFVPRHIRRDPKRPLSSHSFGVAIDLNVAWNGYGKRPAPKGVLGSVQELVPYFMRSGFAWGGHFSGNSIDGMHFELALR